MLPYPGPAAPAALATRPHCPLGGTPVAYVHQSNADGWFVTPSRDRQFERTSALVRRSSLILPVNVRRFVERAYARGADAIVLDLEDSVPVQEKASARKLVRDSLPLAARGGAEVLVRVNNDPALL